MKTKLSPLPATLSTKWRNMAYDKSGKSYRGIIIHDTQAEALASMDELERTLGEQIIGTQDSRIDPDNYAYAISLPY